MKEFLCNCSSVGKPAKLDFSLKSAHATQSLLLVKIVYKQEDHMWHFHHVNALRFPKADLGNILPGEEAVWAPFSGFFVSHRKTSQTPAGRRSSRSSQAGL